MSFMSGVVLLLVCAASLIAVLFMIIYCFHKSSNVNRMHHHDGHVLQEQELQTEVVYDVPVFPDKKNKNDDHQNSVTDGEVIVHQNAAYDLVFHTTSADDIVVCAPSSTLVKNQGQLQSNISDGEMKICQNVAYEVFPN